MMHFSVCVLLLSLAFVHGQLPEEIKKCFPVFHPASIKCCNDAFNMDNVDDIHKCFENVKMPPEGPLTCDVDICIATKMGYLGTEEGTANKAALKQKLETMFPDSPEKVQTIQRDCVDGDVSKYGPPDACELFKLKNCIQLHLLQGCEDWDTQSPCPAVKGQVAECAKMFM